MRLLRCTLFGCVILISQVLSQTASAKVWDSGTNIWTDGWEIIYQDWVSKQWTEDFFMRPSATNYYRIPHDCADAIYLMRAVFSYENKLPFKVHYLNKKDKYLENNMTTWDKLPEDQRFRAFSVFMNDRVGTRSFARDSFPIELAQIKAGDLYTEPGTHAYAITGITDTGVTAIMSSTTPASPKNMIQLFSFPFFIPHDKVGQTDGYRRFKWPRNIDKPANQQAGYSSEQYEIAEQVGLDYVPFTDVIAKKLRRREEPLEEKTMRLMHSLCSFAKERVNYVNDGIEFVKSFREKENRQCMTATEYDYYSTPSRDKRLLRFFKEVEKIAYQGGELTEDQINAQVLARTIFHPELPDGLLDQLDNFCGLAIYPGDDVKHINLRQLWDVLSEGRVSADPHASFDNRWGLSDSKFVGSCKTY